MANLVDSWLNGIGLGYAVPIFAGQGIDSPDMLSELDVVDFPELGISDQNDRKKLFYLIQRVKLALARGRENKAAPQADSAVSSVPAAATSTATATHRETSGAKEQLAVENASISAAQTSVRFRGAAEAPAARGVVSPRAPARNNFAAGRHATPAKVQRMPPSQRRSKMPHADGTVRRRQQQTLTHACIRTSSPGADRARQQQQPVGRMTLATPETGDAVLGIEPDPTTRAFRQEEQGVGGGEGGGGGVRGPATTASETRTSRPTKINKPSEHHRSVLEPVQLDEVGERTRASSSTDTAERVLMPSPLSLQQHHPAPGECTARVISSMNVSRLAVTRERTEQSPCDAQEPHAGAPLATVSVAPMVPTQEVARLHPSKRDTPNAGGGSNGQTPAQRLEMPDGHDSAAGYRSVTRRRNDLQRQVPPQSLPPKEVAMEGVHGGENQAAAAAAAEGGQGESAAELAVHLISAHREDVRSALAAARKDMDLVSKADQDRQPASLMEYAREVERVLGQRLAAGARLRTALDSYVTLRQASRGGAAAGTTTREGRGFQGQGGLPREGGRAVHA